MEYSFRDEQRKVRKRKKVAKSTLSFAVDDEGGDDSGEISKSNGDEDQPAKRAKTRKNPNVDTSFLPDREREEAERREREELRQEWLRKQEDMKKEEIEITYSYWDGSGHRKSVTVSLVHKMKPVPDFRSHSRHTRAVISLKTFSARKGTTLLRSSRSAGSNSPSCGE